MKRKLPALFSKNILLFPLMGVIAVIIGFVGISAVTGPEYATGQECTGTCVNLTPSGMEPGEIAVKKGEFVQFNSADGKKHNISLGEGAGGDEQSGHQAHGGKHEHRASLASGDFEADEAWRVQFDEVGTYQLHDHYNPDLNILIIVYEPSNQ